MGGVKNGWYARIIIIYSILFYYYHYIVYSTHLLCIQLIRKIICIK